MQKFMLTCSVHFQISQQHKTVKNNRNWTVGLNIRVSGVFCREIWKRIPRYTGNELFFSSWAVLCFILESVFTELSVVCVQPHLLPADISDGLSPPGMKVSSQFYSPHRRRGADSSLGEMSFHPHGFGLWLLRWKQYLYNDS